MPFAESDADIAAEYLVPMAKKSSIEKNNRRAKLAKQQAPAGGRG